MPDAPIDAPFRLEGFLIRPALNDIEGPQGNVRVNPKAMEVLLALAQRPEEVCTKQEILNAVWTDLFVGDEVLSTAVWELRRALGDSAKSPRFIQTVPRRGYRLLVRPLPEDTKTPNPDLPSIVFPAKPVLLAIAAGVLLLSLASAIFRSEPPKTSQSETEVRAIVVLPFEDLGDDPHDQALADGLTDTLITSLAGVDGLRVVSRTTSMTYRNRSLTTPEIATELGVDALVEGTLARSGDRIVLNAQLIDAQSEAHLWAETYERRFENLLDLQVEVARSIGAAISRRLDIPPMAVTSSDNETDTDNSLLRWRFRTGGEVWTTPVAVADAVVFGSRDGMLYSVAAADGIEQWRLRIGDEVLTRALILDDAVFAASVDGTVVAAGAAGGIERWRFHIDGNIKSPLVGERGIVVAASEDGRVVALDATSGRTLWTWSGTGGVDGLAMESGSVVASGFGGTITVLDVVSGHPLWSVKVAEWLGQPATIDHHQVLVPSTTGHVIALDLTDGTELWRAPAAAPSEISTWRDRLFVGGEGAVIRALSRDKGAELWRFDALGATTSPSIHGDLVFVGSRDDNLYAIDAWTGELRWRAELRTWVTTSAVAIDSGIILGTLDGSVLCLDDPGSSGLVLRETTGFAAVKEHGDERTRGFDIVVTGNRETRPRVRWRHHMDGPVLQAPAITDSLVLATGAETLTAINIEVGEQRWSVRLPGEGGTPPVIVASIVIVGTRDGFAVAYDLTNGDEIWRFAAGGAIISTPSLGESTLYFGSRDGFLYAVDPTTGHERWRRQLDTIHSSPLVLGNRIWVTGRGDALWVLDAADGRVLRSTATADWAVADPVATKDFVIVASSNGTVEALDRATGASAWRVSNPGEIWFRPLADQGRYFFGSADHHIYALDIGTGRELWRRRTANRVLSTVASWNNLVMVGSHDRSLHAFRADDGTPEWRLATTGVVGNPTVRGNLLGVGSFDGYLYLVELD